MPRRTPVGLRATLHAANTATRSKAAEQLAWGYWVAGSILPRFLEPDAAFMAVRQAFALLLTAEGISPEWIRHQRLARAVTRDLLTAERTRSTPLAARTVVVPGSPTWW